MTVGTRIGPRAVRTAWSFSRTGSVIHSSHITGRMLFSPSISSAVATFVAIWQNASCGVRMWIACQLRFSTRTIVLFSMSVIKAFAHSQRLRAVGVCSLLVILKIANRQSQIENEDGCLAWFCSRSSGVRDRRTPDYATRQWSPGKVLPLRLLGVGQT